MRSFSGRLRAGGRLREFGDEQAVPEVPTNLHFGREHIAFNFQVICEFHIVTGRFSFSLNGVVHTANKEITPCVK